MRKKLIISAMILCSITIFAQDNDNPYSIFGYEPKISEVTYSEIELFYLHNIDTTAFVQTLAFDFENGNVYLYGINNLPLGTLLLDKETVARFTTIDPLCEKYYSVSPYAYVLNNPVRFIDPDGLSHYSINPEGHVTLTKQTDDKFDMLFAGENSIRVNDQSILSELATKRDKKEYNGSYAVTKSSEVGNVFTFAANNTNVEWGLSGFKNGDYVISTIHKEDKVTPATAIKGFSEKDMTFKVHSHPGADATRGASFLERGGPITDMDNIKSMAHRFNNAGIYTEKQFPKHFVYHPDSKNLYQYTPFKSSIPLGQINSNTTLLYRISNNSKSPFFGFSR